MYITVDDVKRRLKDNFESLYKLPADQTDLDTDMATADGLVNSYVGKRYATPVTDATAVVILKGLTLDVFEPAAWRRSAGDELPKKIADAAQEAEDRLKAIATGAMTLGGATALSERPTGGADAILVTGNDPEFTRTQMEGF